MTRVDWSRVDAALDELVDREPVDAAVDEGLRLGDLRFRRTLRMLQAAATAGVVAVTGAALMLQGAVHAQGESGSSPPPRVVPMVQSLNPQAGSHEGGLTVSISGRHLGDVDTVLFGATAVSDLEEVSDDVVVVVTPAHAPGPVPVRVVAGDETSSADPAPTFTFLTAPAATGPRLTMLSPDSGPPAGGTEVTVWGSRLDDARAVSFGESRVDSDRFLTSSDTSITLRTPSHEAGQVHVTVTTGAGTSGPLTFTFTGESPPGPTDEIPVVKSVDPGSGSVGGGEQVTVSGANLGDATKVEFGEVEATITSQDEGTLTVTTPRHDAGEVAVVVTGPAGPSADTEAARYTYLSADVPPPVVTGIEPDVGPTVGGQPVTIRGSALAHAMSVDFGGVKVTTFQADSEGAISLVIPPHGPGLAEITVTTPGGTSEVNSKVAAYEYLGPPTVTDVEPPEGCIPIDQEVTITGTGFTGPGDWFRGVTFGDAAATVTPENVSFGEIKVVPPPRSAGTVPVTVTTAAGPSVPAGKFSYSDCVVD